jgi:hypothetical protein
MNIPVHSPVELNAREKRALASFIASVESAGGFNDGHLIPLGEIRDIKINVENGVREGSFAGWLRSTGRPPDLTIVIHVDFLHKLAREQERADAPSGFSVMAYPNATTADRTLKHALLYFDRVFFITPEAFGVQIPNRVNCEGDSESIEFRFIDRWHSNPEAHEAQKLTDQITKFGAATFELRRTGLVHLLPPSRHLAPEFYKSIQQDLLDPAFVNLVEAAQIRPFYLGASKVVSMGWLGKGPDFRIPRNQIQEHIWQAIDRNEGLFGGFGWLRVSAVRWSWFLGHEKGLFLDRGWH